ncbi:MAG TPA: hypothetical protein VFH51_15750, partial [Myxococcota bacterium]|nr:hypothetical protein [Myxococcota bacterium]
VLLPGPLVLETVCTLTSPFGLHGALPRPVEVVTPLGTYQAHFELQDRYLVYTHRLVLRERLVRYRDRPVLEEWVDSVRRYEARSLQLVMED